MGNIHNATTYQVLAESKLQRKTYDIGSFIKWFCRRQKGQKLCQSIFEGPAFNLVKAFHKNNVFLQYQMDECHKLLTNKVDLNNPEGHQILRSVYEPLPLGGPPGQERSKRTFITGIEKRTLAQNDLSKSSESILLEKNKRILATGCHKYILDDIVVTSTRSSILCPNCGETSSNTEAHFEGGEFLKNMSKNNRGVCEISPVAIVASRAVDPVGSPSSTTIDQDEQSTSTSPTNQEIQSQVTHQDYDNSDPVPPRQNVVPTAEKTDSSQQGLEFLFSPLLEEYYNPTHGQAEENNNNQAPNASFQEDEFINPFCTRVQEIGESSSRNIDNTDVHSFQPQSHDYRWTRDHPLEQVHGNLTMPVQKTTACRRS
ncbi:hypothetical protein Tco_0655583 [Tanacetum coccineum]|uniref:Uncharacterized protein n=1 Tax=Tanacetum coccineum TaxID=301880 RepID=A0ABQ4X6F5_9ASTR